MKKLMTTMALGMTAAVLLSTPASANIAVQQMDQFGCRWESSTQDYRCYSGANAGRSFRSQEDMFRAARITPVYIDDSGAPRPMPPHASRGNEQTATDAGTTEDNIQVSW